jgi:hypothetical protein
LQILEMLTHLKRKRIKRHKRKKKKEKNRKEKNKTSNNVKEVRKKKGEKKQKQKKQCERERGIKMIFKKEGKFCTSMYSASVYLCKHLFFVLLHVV